MNELLEIIADKDGRQKSPPKDRSISNRKRSPERRESREKSRGKSRRENSRSTSYDKKKAKNKNDDRNDESGHRYAKELLGIINRQIDIFKKPQEKKSSTPSVNITNNNNNSGEQFTRVLSERERRQRNRQLRSASRKKTPGPHKGN